MFVSVFILTSWRRLMTPLLQQLLKQAPTEQQEETERKQSKNKTRNVASLPERESEVTAVTEDESEEVSEWGIEPPAEVTSIKQRWSKEKFEEKRSVKGQELVGETGEKSEKLEAVSLKSEKTSEKLSRAAITTSGESKAVLTEPGSSSEVTAEKRVRSEQVFDVKAELEESIESVTDLEVRTDTEFLSDASEPEAEPLKSKDVPPQRGVLLNQDQMKPSVSLKPEEEIKTPTATPAGGTITMSMFNSFISLWLVCIFCFVCVQYPQKPPGFEFVSFSVAFNLLSVAVLSFSTYLLCSVSFFRRLPFLSVQT